MITSELFFSISESFTLHIEIKSVLPSLVAKYLALCFLKKVTRVFTSLCNKLLVQNEGEKKPVHLHCSLKWHMLKILRLVFQIQIMMWRSTFMLTTKKSSRCAQEKERIHCISVAPICQWHSHFSPFGVQRLHMALVAFLYC